MSECYICYGRDAVLQCAYCNNPNVCLECIQNDSIVNNRKPVCFGCFSEYDISTLIKQVPVDWIRCFYIPHVSNLLLAEERIILPAYMKYADEVAKSRKYEEIVQILTKRLNYAQEMSNILKKINMYANIGVDDYLNTPHDIPMLSDEDMLTLGHMAYYSGEIRSVKEEISKIRRPIDNILDVEEIIKGDRYDEIRGVNVRCATKNCKGFINESNLCPLCNSNTCLNCMELMEEKHVCDPNILLSIQSIHDMYRPCPKCDIYIIKTSGCNQMFCTNCKTFFNYETGDVYKRTVENPEYTDYLKRGGDKINFAKKASNNCNDFDLTELDGKKVYLLKSLGIFQTYRTCSELLDYVADINYVISSLRKTRKAVDVMYLTDMIDEDKWKHYLISLNIRGLYEIQKMNLVETFRNILIYLLNSLLIEDNIGYYTSERGIGVILEEIRCNFNRDIKRISDIFNYGEMISIDILWKLRDTHIWINSYDKIKRSYVKNTYNSLKTEIENRKIPYNKVLSKEEMVTLCMFTHDNKLNPLVLDSDSINGSKIRNLMCSLLKYYYKLDNFRTVSTVNNRRYLLSVIKNPVLLEEIMDR